ncbi:MAG: RimK/LysX family protein, partial [Myxococcales bacterium]
IVPLALAARPDAADAMPVWVAAGASPGPRITILGAPRGFEVGAARVAAALRVVIDAGAMHGGLVVAPVFRPGGRFAARGQAVRSSAEWRFPGDPGGNRHAREAFALFSELVVGSSVLVLLTAADPGLTAALAIQGDFDDPRVRRLSAHAPVTAAVHKKAALGSLAAAAQNMGCAVVELLGPDENTADQSILAAVTGLLAMAGTGIGLPQGGAVSARAFAPAVVLGAGVGGTADEAAGKPLTVITQTTTVRAPAGGLLEEMVSPGALVERGGLLARIVPPLFGRAVEVVAPHDGVVLHVTTRAGVRPRALLLELGRVTRAVVARGQRAKRLAASPVLATSPLATPSSLPLHVGWVERVSLPSLGVERLRAKIDTGARTSALHVTRMTAVGTTEGPHRRPILELTLPAGSRRGAPPATVRVLVRDYVQVKDTSGRTERRPVIETTLRLGTLERRIRVTLTNRGDMLFPLLIGRTALGPGVVVDPSRRLLLNERNPARPSRSSDAAPASRPGKKNVVSAHKVDRLAKVAKLSGSIATASAVRVAAAVSPEARARTAAVPRRGAES